MSNNNTHIEFDQLLNDCLDQLHQGASVAACLQQHPAHAAELEPVLVLSAALQALPYEPPSETARAAGKEQMLAAVAERETAVVPSPSPFARTLTQIQLFLQTLFTAEATPMTNIARTVIVFFLVSASFLFTFNASAGSLPGDPLYGFKRLGEQTRVMLVTPEEKAALQAQLATRRLQELEQLLATNKRARLTIDGAVTIIDDNTIEVEGFLILVTDNTSIGYAFSDGDIIQVTLAIEDGVLIATKIEESPLKLLPIFDANDGGANSNDDGNANDDINDNDDTNENDDANDNDAANVNDDNGNSNDVDNSNNDNAVNDNDNDNDDSINDNEENNGNGDDLVNDNDDDNSNDDDSSNSNDDNDSNDDSSHSNDDDLTNSNDDDNSNDGDLTNSNDDDENNNDDDSANDNDEANNSNDANNGNDDDDSSNSNDDGDDDNGNDGDSSGPGSGDDDNDEDDNSSGRDSDSSGSGGDDDNDDSTGSDSSGSGSGGSDDDDGSGSGDDGDDEDD